MYLYIHILIRLWSITTSKTRHGRKFLSFVWYLLKSPVLIYLLKSPYTVIELKFIDEIKNFSKKSGFGSLTVDYTGKNGYSIR